MGQYYPQQGPLYPPEHSPESGYYDDAVYEYDETNGGRSNRSMLQTVLAFLAGGCVAVDSRRPQTRNPADSQELDDGSSTIEVSEVAGALGYANQRLHPGVQIVGAIPCPPLAGED